MMAGLFIIFFIALLMIAIGWRIPAMIVLFVNLGLCLAMFLHHVTSELTINL